MKKILVPTDFSDTARNAIDYALQLALQANAQLVLFNAYHPTPVSADMPPETRSLEEIGKWSYASLNAIREDIYYRHGESLVVECVNRCGFAVEEIGDFALEYDVDLIVMGMQGTGYISEKVIGSVTTALMRDAPCPVLVIDRHVRFAPVKRVVFACDYLKPPRRPVFDALKDFVSLFPSPWIYVVNVKGDNNPQLSFLESRAQPRIREFLNHEGHSFHSVREDDIVAGLRRFSEEKEADLMVMVPRRYSFWRGIFYSPLTKRMAFHTTLPLLILQP